MTEQPGSVTSDDKLWSALGYPIPLIAIIVMLMEDKKSRPFIKFHAVQSLIFNVAVWVLIFKRGPLRTYQVVISLKLLSNLCATNTIKIKPIYY